MNRKKLFTAIALSAVGVFQAACLPLNFAQSPKGRTANQATENRQAENLTNAQTLANKTKDVSSKNVKTAPPKPKEDNFVCPEPNLPCNHQQKEFDDWELSFRMPSKIVPNRIYKSAPFYAVILKKYDEGCDELDSNSSVEPERKRLQKLFPSRKVFAEYSCPNMAAVNYNFAGKLSADGEQFLYMDYIAVYAGVTKEEADEIYKAVRADFPQAEVKRMTAEYSQIEQ